MGQLFFVYLQNSLQLTVIVLLLLAFSPLLARRYSAQCRYYLWAVVFVAMILPIRTKITLALPEIFQPILPQSIDSTFGTASIADTVRIWNWHYYAEPLWVVGMLCFLGWHIFQHLRFLFAIKRWSEEIEDSDVLEQFALTKGELRIRNHITIKFCPCIKTPMMIGLLHPAVLLPQVDFSQNELPLILKHELVHYKRKDLWYKTLMMIALAIHWFNPVVHLMVKSVLSLCEISCDEKVLRKIDAKGRAQYGEAIIGVVRNANAYQTVLSTNFYSGTKGMKKRIYAMMDMTKKRFSLALFMVVFVVTVCGTTAFSLLPAQAQGIVHDSDKGITLNSNPENVKELPAQPSTLDIEESSQEKASQIDNALLPTESEPRLIPDDEYTSDIEENSQEKADQIDNALLPTESEPRLIPDDEYTLAEPSQGQTYYLDVPRLIINDEQ